MRRKSRERAARRKLRGGPKRLRAMWKHRLSNIDEVNRLATCAECGDSTPIRFRKRAGCWACSSGSSFSSPKSKKKGKCKDQWHRLSNIDETNRKGTCTICGENASISYRRNKGRWVCMAYDSDSKNHNSVKLKQWNQTRAEFIEAQRGLCAICGRQKRLVLDHCHKTGQRRAALCFSCNSGLGLFLDDPELMRKAANYIERHQMNTLRESYRSSNSLLMERVRDSGSPSRL